MRLLEGLSGIIFEKIAGRYLKSFREKSPENILRRTLEVIDPEARHNLEKHVRRCQHLSGGFVDRAGNPDLYYTLFGWFLADSLGMDDMLPSVARFTEECVNEKDLKGVHLHCAAILYANLGKNIDVRNNLKKHIRLQLNSQDGKQPAYTAFITLLACYYLNDFKGLYSIKNKLEKLKDISKLPSPVISALLVLQHSFGKPIDVLKQRLLSFSASGGGFKATLQAPIPDLLSTAVCLYALGFANHDMRLLKPAALSFIDELYTEGGFMANLLDPDPDIEYTFYGFLALGSLAD